MSVSSFKFRATPWLRLSGERQHRVKLNTVGGDSALPVEGVEEAHSGEGGRAVQFREPA